MRLRYFNYSGFRFGSEKKFRMGWWLYGFFIILFIFVRYEEIYFNYEKEKVRW